MWRRHADQVDEQVTKPEAAPKRKRSCMPFAGTYESVVEAIIRPPRAPYEASNLGPTKFLLQGHVFKRFDLQITNPRGLALECSWWRPRNRELISDGPLPCVVCLHGNSSCRLEAMQHVRMVLTRGITMFAFDFAGCGLSEGDYITLGYHEREDVSTIISYLRESGEVSTIALWGRSMGAATALLHGHRDPSIAGLVLDSPFSSLEMVVRELIDKVPLRFKPSLLVAAAIRLVRKTVLKRTGMDILKLKPIENVHTCFIPALFVAGVNDDLIDPHHTHDIHELYAGDKNMVLIDGDHNSARPEYLVDSVSIFFYERLCLPAGLPGELPPVQVPLGPSGMPEQESGLGMDARGSGIFGEMADPDDAAIQEAILMSLISPDNPSS
mmetsp:Transcript_44078/g.102963  ORF Transcript_44078/g.102963 Transcript_44078/m.102963 type:complete len:383 (+) Transcript_44078:61-1209(+)